MNHRKEPPSGGFFYGWNLPKDILIIVNACFYTYNRFRFFKPPAGGFLLILSFYFSH